MCECAVRAVLVVMRDIRGEDVREVATAEDQQPVEALAADGPDSALCVGPCLRRPHGRFDHPDAFGAEDLVEVAGELAVTSRTRTRGRTLSSSSCVSRLHVCWVTHRPSGLVVIPARRTRRVASSMKNKT